MDKNKSDNIKFTSKDGIWECLGNSQFRTEFTTKSNGYDVSGTVCDSWLRPTKVNFNK